MVKLGLVPAAGAGVRAYPATNFIPKVMLEIGGKPLIMRNIEILRDQCGIRDVFVIVGYMADVIKAFLKDGSELGIRITYIDCDKPSSGLASGLLLARDRIRESFITILGDELYLNTNHAAVTSFSREGYSAACGLMRTDDFKTISKNYTVKLSGDRIASLEEKPEKIESDILGCGTYLFTPEIFRAIERTRPSKRSGRVELTDAINTLARERSDVYPIFLDGVYHNINSVEDYNDAHYDYRSMFFKTFKTSVIVPAYNEEESIASVVRDFLGKADEVFVVDNSSKDNTRDAAVKAGARVETVSLAGYGDTIKYGLDHASGDIMVVVEADHSFKAKDLGKFLEYLKDSDMVIGTRTTRQMVEQGANMKGALRWGNVFVGKIVEALWWGQEPRFTDVGCTYRAIWRDAYLKIRDNLIATGPEFSPEMMIEVLRARKRIIEIPVTYYRRLTGTSKHSENYFKVSKTALKMLGLIFRKRMGL